MDDRKNHALNSLSAGTGGARVAANDVTDQVTLEIRATSFRAVMDFLHNVRLGQFFLIYQSNVLVNSFSTLFLIKCDTAPPSGLRRTLQPTSDRARSSPPRRVST